MPFIRANDLNFYYEQNGSGRDVLVINGTGNDLRKKPSIMDSPLSGHFRVTAYDQRGLGQTDKPSDGYNMRAYADDAAALMDALGIRTAMLLGISFGGMVAQEMAIRHGHLLSRVAMWCTAAGGAGGASYPLHELEDLSPEVRVTTGMKLNDTRIDDDWLKANPEAIDAARERLDMSAYEDEPHFAAGRHGQLMARAQHDCFDRLSEISCPVFLGGGHYDGIATSQAMQALHDQIPNAKLTFYQGGHLFMLQDGKVFPDLLAFFNEETE